MSEYMLAVMKELLPVFGFLAAIVLLYLPPLSSPLTFYFAVMKDFYSFDSVK